jgi:hypothetical protein
MIKAKTPTITAMINQWTMRSPNHMIDIPKGATAVQKHTTAITISTYNSFFMMVLYTISCKRNQIPGF